MFCRRCGASNLDDAIYCVKCGQLCAPPDAARLDYAPTEATLPRGTVLSNRYVIERLLGVGGMGQVYLAEDRVLRVPIAIKTVRDLLRQDPGSFARLIEEARKAMRLAHEHIVRVNHFEDGELLKFLVMEYVEGETLAHRLARERRLPEEEARRIGIALCDALAYAHAKGVVHRDVKPGNVLLGPDGAVKLADFGIARVARDSMSRLTRVVTSGTLIYMAPEQVDGEVGTAQSDLYALGVVLYEAVAGDPPFHTGDLTRQILTKAPAPLADVTDEYSALVLGVLAKKPEDRPAGAAAVRVVLDGTAARRREEGESRRQEAEARRAAEARAREEVEAAQSKTDEAVRRAGYLEAVRRAGEKGRNKNPRQQGKVQRGVTGPGLRSGDQGAEPNDLIPEGADKPTETEPEVAEDKEVHWDYRGRPVLVPRGLRDALDDEPASHLLRSQGTVEDEAEKAPTEDETPAAGEVRHQTLDLPKAPALILMLGALTVLLAAATGNC